MKHTVSAQEYMDEYRSKISSKYKELKTSDQLTNSLQKDESDFKSQMRSYVTQLQSTDEHKDQTKQYHKDMKKVRKFFAMIFDDEKDRDMPQRMKSTFAASKEYFYQTEDEDRAKTEKVLKQVIKHVPVYYKERMLGKIEQRIHDPEIFRAEIQKLIDSKPHMELREKIKEVEGRFIQQRPLWPVVGGGLIIFWAVMFPILLGEPKDPTRTMGVGFYSLVSALRVELAIQGSIEHTRKLHREQKEKRVEKNAKQMFRR